MYKLTKREFTAELLYWIELYIKVASDCIVGCVIHRWTNAAICWKHNVNTSIN